MGVLHNIAELWGPGRLFDLTLLNPGGRINESLTGNIQLSSADLQLCDAL